MWSRPVFLPSCAGFGGPQPRPAVGLEELEHLLDCLAAGAHGAGATGDQIRIPPLDAAVSRRILGAMMAGVVAVAAAGAGSVVITMIWLRLVSSVQVLARDLVCTVCSTSKLVGLVSLMMVSVPSPCELMASMVFGLNPPPSVPRPMGTVARILPSSALSTTQV